MSWSWVMWVMGQLCDGSHGSWVTKDDPFPSLVSHSEELDVKCELGRKTDFSGQNLTLLVRRRFVNDAAKYY